MDSAFFMIKILIVFLTIFVLSLIRFWPTSNIFGESRINSLEYFGDCWQGDVRICDYDLFD
ncbi:MAG: hypothetical protein UW30_C0001G0062 [Candidatus Giovannonibacteria bacterium GW2011_GWA2_44_13b]|uniref:Uncharacterized protein n=2 Tax=Candidatus Giovannoniibacteriota TaxID=1752738 RepID=A0A0G1JE88_9BACT|nr:MAG: hypothetical protein UW30_C0001G0062 [Candidatus Giovannonibacteria bacterium GW2011_GWA2_44_13b]OGF83244.1 MAG: hypothetical protein A2924_02925 [Candidatus Giovannonibacteria bacterium RIFCSPLOWO2_01_FULL_44_16]